ncbi:unnamed protein product [Orchesella dallaii]|uniref:Uncharacterized protein n=1 Tax=Orchesella dallaii TaxID=48710 RepID=A0ABP1R3R6_9HEXA
MLNGEQNWTPDPNQSEYTRMSNANNQRPGWQHEDRNLDHFYERQHRRRAPVDENSTTRTERNSGDQEDERYSSNNRQPMPSQYQQHRPSYPYPMPHNRSYVADSRPRNPGNAAQGSFRMSRSHHGEAYSQGPRYRGVATGGGNNHSSTLRHSGTMQDILVPRQNPEPPTPLFASFAGGMTVNSGAIVINMLTPDVSDTPRLVHDLINGVSSDAPTTSRPSDFPRRDGGGFMPTICSLRHQRNSTQNSTFAFIPLALHSNRTTSPVAQPMATSSTAKSSTFPPPATTPAGPSTSLLPPPVAVELPASSQPPVLSSTVIAPVEPSPSTSAVAAPHPPPVAFEHPTSSSSSSSLVSSPITTPSSLITPNASSPETGAAQPSAMVPIIAEEEPSTSTATTSSRDFPMKISSRSLAKLKRVTLEYFTSSDAKASTSAASFQPSKKASGNDAATTSNFSNVSNQSDRKWKQESTQAEQTLTILSPKITSQQFKVVINDVIRQNLATQPAIGPSTAIASSSGSPPNNIPTTSLPNENRQQLEAHQSNKDAEVETRYSKKPEEDINPLTHSYNLRKRAHRKPNGGKGGGDSSRNPKRRMTHQRAQLAQASTSASQVGATENMSATASTSTISFETEFTEDEHVPEPEPNENSSAEAHNPEEVGESDDDDISIVYERLVAEDDREVTVKVEKEDENA